MANSDHHDDTFFRRLVENASDLIVVVDGEGRLEYLSPSVERVLGFAPADVLGQPALALLHPDDVAATQAALADELAGRTTLWYVEARVRSAGGEWVPLEVKGRRDPLAPAPRVVVHARDLRERLRVEQQLRDHYAWTRALVDASPLAIVTLDRSLTVTSWNPSAERMFGWSAQDVLGGPLPIIPDDSPAEREWLEQTLGEGKTFAGYETHRRRRDGRLVDVTVSLAPIRGDDGSVTGAIKLLADNSAQKTLERQFVQAERLDATGRLAGGIAHDFNNLLGTIVTSAGLLCDELEQGTPLREDAEAILDAARRATDLTRQLLTLGRRRSMKTRRVDLGSFVSALEAETRSAAPAGVTVAFNAPPAGVHVVADPDQLRDSLQRLVSNAYDAMPSGGAVTVDVQVASLQGDDAAAVQLHAGTYAMIAVSDAGIGMAPNVLARCFEPFFTTKQRRRNPGLGLATAYAIARQCGGGLAASSAAGIGTTMRFYLPVVADEPALQRRTPVRGIARQGAASETILLVDDDATFRAVVRRALTQQGYTVLDAGGGAEALTVLEQHSEKIDLLVADLVMPDISGRELGRRMRALRPGLRVLYMSGYSPDVLRERGGLDSCEAFIQKPFSPADFVGAVRGLFDVLT